jgi:predicted HicB family RNase H-like nuclease
MKQHQTMRIDEGIIKALKAQAKKERRSLNNYLENVLQDHIQTLTKGK